MRQAGLLDTAEYKMTPGTYTGQSHGFSCIDFVTVDVTVDESSIVSLSLQDNFVDDQDSYENRYLCTGAFEELEPEILELQSIGVDAVTAPPAPPTASRTPSVPPWSRPSPPPATPRTKSTPPSTPCS